MTLKYIMDKYQLEEAPVIKMHCSRKVTFPRILRRCGLNLGVEVGVERGVFSSILFKVHPGLKLYGVDAWQEYAGYRDHVKQDRLDEFFRSTKSRMKGLNFEPIREFSIKAARRFEDESLDFVFIDAAHDYDSVKEDIAAWAPKVRKDGIVSGHDYMNLNHTDQDGMVTPYGVKQAVNEWVDQNNIKPLFVLKKDKCPSWFYVKT